MNRSLIVVLVVLALAGAVGFNLYRMAYYPYGTPPGWPFNQTTNTAENGGYGSPDLAKITFSDPVESNTDKNVPVNELTLLNEDMESVMLSDLQMDRNLLLVVLRGAPLCPFCAAQTSRLVSNYQRFKDLGAEVAVVFPGTQDDLTQLLNQAKLDGQQLPFSILVDVDLTTVEKLGIEGSKAKPSTFIIDRDGRTRFAYVGASFGDRPSIKALLAALERIKPADGRADKSDDNPLQDS